MKLPLLPTAALLLVACTPPAKTKESPAQDTKEAHDAATPAKAAAPADTADAATSAEPATNDVEGFKADPKYDEHFKPEALTDEEKKLLERDPKTLTPEERKAWSYAYRKKSLANPNSPGARAIRQAGESILSGNVKPNMDYKGDEPISTPPPQATE